MVELEKALMASRSVAVLLGKHEMGRWQKREYSWALDWHTEHPDDTSSQPSATLIPWLEAVEFCNKLSDKEGLARFYSADHTRLDTNGYRLPTEAEWEYACRAKSRTQFCDGDETDMDNPRLLSEYAVFAGRAGLVGSKIPNGWSLFDMHGNVWEWCHGWYAQDYCGQSPESDPRNDEPGLYRVYRGGSWLSGPGFLRSAYREWSEPDYRGSHLGFRVARSSVRRD